MKIRPINLFLLAWLFGFALQVLVLGIDIYVGKGMFTDIWYVRFWIDHTELKTFAVRGNITLGLIFVLFSMCLYSTVLAVFIFLIYVANKAFFIGKNSNRSDSGHKHANNN